MDKNNALGIIGGSGLYEIEDLKIIEEVDLNTPFGKASDSFIIGEIKGQKLIFLPRHGRGHCYLPSEINYQANIWGMKKLGVDCIISISAVGSLKEEIKPGHFVIPDQLIDLTKRRKSTFFGNGVVGHVMFADPYCKGLQKKVHEVAEKCDVTVHLGGTYVCIEGPQFSTRAESNLYRSWNVDVIGMTALPEAKLAKEAEICYTTLAMATDYDCWNETEQEVSVESVIQVMNQNIFKTKELIKSFINLKDHFCVSSCQESAKYAIMTKKNTVPNETKQNLALLYGKYF